MKSEEHLDQMVDLLLSELLAEERPPDLRQRVMDAVGEMPSAEAVQRRSARKPVLLPSAKPSRIPALAIAASVMLVGVAGALLHHQRISLEKTPVLTSVSGIANRQIGEISPGEMLSTGADSGATLTYRDGTVVELAADTNILVRERSMWNRSKGIELISGGFRAEVAAQRAGMPLFLVSEDAQAEVVGTSFAFDRNPERTRLEVTEGAVRFMEESGEGDVVVKAGRFAEAGSSGFRHGEITPPTKPGIIRFTLIDAATNMPLREAPLSHGETIHLSSLPAAGINIRADYEGEPPAAVKITAKRHFGKPTNLGSFESATQEHPPFFVAGKNPAASQADDCAAWMPNSGFYHLSAEAIYEDPEKQKNSKPLKISFSIEK